jgi:predicted RNA-binding protein YlxR (DUF448 family)
VQAKKIPMRMCLGCSQMLPKRELCRVVKNKQGEISLDFTGKKPGRGAYVCPKKECLQKARKAKRFERTFSQIIPDEVWQSLEEELSKHEL